MRSPAPSAPGSCIKGYPSSTINPMNQAEFDKFADEYRNLHSRSIRASGEQPEFFTEYKVMDAARLAADAGLGTSLRVMDFGAGVGNSVPFFVKYNLACRLACVDVSTRSLEIAEERFPGLADYREFDGRTLHSRTTAMTWSFQPAYSITFPQRSMWDCCGRFAACFDQEACSWFLNITRTIR